MFINRTADIQNKAGEEQHLAPRKSYREKRASEESNWKSAEREQLQRQRCISEE